MKILGVKIALVFVLVHLTVTTAVNKRQCLRDPSFCPQTCIITIGGCTTCSSACRQILGKTSLNLFNQPNYQPGGPLSGPGGFQTGGVSLINPNSMTSFNNPQNPAVLTGSGSGSQPGYIGPVNPGNIGPMNPFLHSAQNPGSPSGYNNVGNMGQLTGAGINPAVPGGQGIKFNPGGFGGNNGGSNQPVTSTTVAPSVAPSCPPLYCPSGNVVVMNGCPVCQATTTPTVTTVLTTRSPLTTVAMTTTSRPRPVSTTHHATCAPLRCVAPCDKGITINAQGCPVCLCK